MLKFYSHKILINSIEFACFARHHSMYYHQSHSNTTKVVLGSTSDNITYTLCHFLHKQCVIIRVKGIKPGKTKGESYAIN